MNPMQAPNVGVGGKDHGNRGSNKDKPFPDCGKGCSNIIIFGVCECASICPWKFDHNGDPVKEE